MTADQSVNRVDYRALSVYDRVQWLENNSAATAMQEFGFALPDGGEATNSAWPVVRMMYDEQGQDFSAEVVGAFPRNIEHMSSTVPTRYVQETSMPAIYSCRNNIGFVFPKHTSFQRSSMVRVMPFAGTDDLTLSSFLSGSDVLTPFLVVSNNTSTMVFFNSLDTQNLHIGKLSAFGNTRMDKSMIENLSANVGIQVPTGAQLLKMCDRLGL